MTYHGIIKYSLADIYSPSESAWSWSAGAKVSLSNQFGQHLLASRDRIQSAQRYEFLHFYLTNVCYRLMKCVLPATSTLHCVSPCAALWLSEIQLRHAAFATWDSTGCLYHSVLISDCVYRPSNHFLEWQPHYISNLCRWVRSESAVCGARRPLRSKDVRHVERSNIVCCRSVVSE